MLGEGGGWGGGESGVSFAAEPSGRGGGDADHVLLSLQSLDLRNKEGWKRETYRERERQKEESDVSLPLAAAHVTHILPFGPSRRGNVSQEWTDRRRTQSERPVCRCSRSSEAAADGLRGDTSTRAEGKLTPTERAK